MEKKIEKLAYGLVFTVIVIFIIPLSVLCNWLTGLILKFICGQLIADGFNLLLNTHRFTPEVVPLICVTLGLFGAFMRTWTTIKHE